jgi:hypothetical protein
VVLLEPAPELEPVSKPELEPKWKPQPEPEPEQAAVAPGAAGPLADEILALINAGAAARAGGDLAEGRRLFRLAAAAAAAAAAEPEAAETEAADTEATAAADADATADVAAAGAGAAAPVAAADAELPRADSGGFVPAAAQVMT